MSDYENAVSDLAVRLIRDLFGTDDNDKILGEILVECVASESEDLFKVGQTYKLIKRAKNGLGVHDSDGLSETFHNAWDVDRADDGSFVICTGEDDVFARFVGVQQNEQTDKRFRKAVCVSSSRPWWNVGKVYTVDMERSTISCYRHDGCRWHAEIDGNSVTVSIIPFTDESKKKTISSFVLIDEKEGL